ncbi:hypothetical protein AUF16_05725 [Enterococcus avium]|nr:hypothetical protein AUF16_05725 [Enterococcus avium]
MPVVKNCESSVPRLTFLNAKLNAISLILNAIYLDLMIFLFSRMLDLRTFYIIGNPDNRMEGSVG